MENTESQPFIGKLTKEDVRKAYFRGKLLDLMSKLQQEEVLTGESIELLETYLAELKQEETALLERFSKILHTKEGVSDVVLESLYEEDLSEEEKKHIQEKDVRERAINEASELMQQIAFSYISLRKGKGGKKMKIPSKEDIMDGIFQLIGLSYYIDEEMLYLRQLYKRRIVEFEKVGKQRKTAEEYAMTTKEYRAYKRLSMMRERIRSFEMAGMTRFKGY